MTQMIKRNSDKVFAAGFVVGIVTFAVMAFTREHPRSTPAREIVLVAKDIAFHQPDQPDITNPPLILKRGEPVKLVLRNEEPGAVLHCFTIGGLNVKTTRSLATGESETLSFTPKEKGRFAYACLMHPMMSGRLIVE